MTQPDPSNNAASTSSASVDDRPHRPADDSEEVYYEGSPMLRGKLGRLLGCFLLGMVLIAIPIALAVEHHAPPVAVWFGCILAGFIVIFIPAVLVRRVRYRISNYRIDSERGLLSTNIDTLELWHVEDISFHQTILNRILGVGSIIILSHDDTTPRLELHGIPNARPLFETLKQRIIAVKRQRGVVKMDSGS